MRREKIEYEIMKLEAEIRELRKKLDEARKSEREVEGIIKRREYVARFTECPCCGTPIDRERILEDIDWYRRRWAELRETIKSIEQEISERKARIWELRDTLIIFVGGEQDENVEEFRYNGGGG